MMPRRFERIAKAILIIEGAVIDHGALRIEDHDVGAHIRAERAADRAIVIDCTRGIELGGGQGGTQVTVVTQSGTNQYHGSLFEYYRGTQLEARDPFNTTGSASFLRNQFGGSAGGPVLLPHYNGRNRTFFFFNYEGNRQYQQQTRFSSVPLDSPEKNSVLATRW